FAAAGLGDVAVRRMVADVRGALHDWGGRAAALEELAAEAEGATRARLYADAAQSRFAADDVEAAAADLQAAEAASPDDTPPRVARRSWRRGTISAICTSGRATSPPPSPPTVAAAPTRGWRRPKRASSCCARRRRFCSGAWGVTTTPSPPCTRRWC